MELFVAAIVLVLAVGLFEVAAQLWGADSRDGVEDDHQRQMHRGAQ